MADIQRALYARHDLRANILKMFPELDGDHQTLNDTLAGIDDLEETIIVVLRNAIEREAVGKALCDLIDQMVARRSRLNEGARKLRAAALQAIQEAGLHLPLRAADMSVSVGRGKPKVQIVDPDKIPDRLCKIVREPSKSLIATELTAGREVPGACLGNAQSFIAIHRT